MEVQSFTSGTFGIEMDYYGKSLPNPGCLPCAPSTSVTVTGGGSGEAVHRNATLDSLSEALVPSREVVCHSARWDSLRLPLLALSVATAINPTDFPSKPVNLCYI